jgi:hypothetical protein
MVHAWLSFEAYALQIAMIHLAKALAFCIERSMTRSLLTRVKPVISAVSGHFRPKLSVDSGWRQICVGLVTCGRRFMHRKFLQTQR